MKNKTLITNLDYPVIEKQLNINGNSFRIIEQGDGPAILFCHGFPDIAESWLHQMKAFSKSAYRSIALDMRGFGNSYSPSDFELYSAQHIVSDLVGILDALEIDTAILVGHD